MLQETSGTNGPGNEVCSDFEPLHGGEVKMSHKMRRDGSQTCDEDTDEGRKKKERKKGRRFQGKKTVDFNINPTETHGKAHQDTEIQQIY